MLASVVAGIIRVVTGVRVCPTLGTTPAQRIYYANHSSHLDFVVIWAALPAELRKRVRPVAAGDYWGTGKVRRYFAESVFRAILVYRGKTTKADNPVDSLRVCLNSPKGD